MAYSENTLIVDIVTNGSGDDVWYSLSVPGAEILSAARTGDVLLRKITRTERNNAATPAVPQSDEYQFFKLTAIQDVEDGSQVAMLFDNGDMYVYDPNDLDYPYLDGTEPGNFTFVPSATAEDEGKVLTVNENGFPSWASGGTGGGVLVVTVDVDTMTLDKTWQEIYDADFAVLRIVDERGILTYICTDCVITAFAEDPYQVNFAQPSSETIVAQFNAHTASDYPVLNTGE